VPGYEILGVLGRGGMGVVYQARQVGLNRLVALKMILAGHHAGAEARDRFRAEAEAVARLHHPNVVQVYEVGEHEGRLYFSMEYCPGGGLDKKLNATPFPPAEAARLIETLAGAVHAAHKQRVIHRDLKPANVLLAADGTPKVADFGLAKKLDEAGQTQSGAVLGTPSYMAPEQAASGVKVVGPAADVYALGAILYELLTGRPPFRGPTSYETVQQVLTDEPAPPRRLQSGVPADLETVCLKCLAKQPGRRYATAQELAEELRRFLDGKPVRARPVGALVRGWKWARRRPALAAAYALLGATLVLGLGGGGATWLWLRAENARDALKAANGALQQARDDLRDANRRLTEHAYADRITLAQREWDAGAARRARVLLSEAGELQEALTPGRHSWECDHLGRRFHQELLVIDSPGVGFSSVAFSPGGQRIAAASWEGTAGLWDAASGDPVAVLRGHKGYPLAVAFSPDGGRVATAGTDNRACLWDSSGEPLAVLEGHTGPVQAAVFTPDGARVVTASQDGTARLWDPTSGKQLAFLEDHRDRLWHLWSVAISPDGGRFATVGGDGTVRLWIARESPEDRDRRRRYWGEQQRLRQRQQAAEAERQGKWFAAAFQVSRLIDADPADPTLSLRRCRAHAMQGLWCRAAPDFWAALAAARSTGKEESAHPPR
jgi:hypothetical protein